MRATRKPATQQVGGLALNKQELRNAREIAQQYPRVEFLYLRENKFEDFDPYIRLENLKMLDLSLNSLQNCSFLWGGSKTNAEERSEEQLQMPALRHLYLTGNYIDALDQFSGMSELETLTLSGNLISSFEGLGSLPNLRVLSLNYNTLATFKHFPFLPSLHSLNLEGNPLDPDKEQHPEAYAVFRRMAVAVCGPELAKVDGIAVTREERTDAWGWGGKVLFAMTEGFVPAAVAEPGAGDAAGIQEEAEAFLWRHQVDPDFVHRSKELSEGDRPLRLLGIGLHPAGDGDPAQPKEGEPVTLSVCLQDARDYQQQREHRFYSQHISAVEFKVDGGGDGSREVFLLGSMNGWRERISMERVQADGADFFHTTLYLAPGEYEYKYLIDGMETVEPEGERRTGARGLCAVQRVATEPDAEPPADASQSTILHIRWLRSNEFNGFNCINEENSLSCVPKNEEVGRFLRAEVLGYLMGDFSTIFFDISALVFPAEPSVRRIALHGEAVENGTLELEVEYVGGEEGPSEVRWLRVRGDVPVDHPDRELDVTKWAEDVFMYKLTAEDVGAVIKVEYTPMREDAPDYDDDDVEIPRTTTGEMAEASSAEVAAAPPAA